MKPLILLTAMTVIGIIGIIGTVEYSEASHGKIYGNVIIDNPCSNSFNVILNHDMYRLDYLTVKLMYNNHSYAGSIFIGQNAPTNSNFTFWITNDYGQGKLIEGNYTIEIIGSEQIHFADSHPEHETDTIFSYLDETVYITKNPNDKSQLCFNLKEHLNGTAPEPPTIPKTRLQLANEKIERLERMLNSTNTSDQDNDQLVSELRSQLNIYRQQLDEKDDIISDQREEIQEQQKKIDKQRKNINNKKGVIEEKNSDSDRLLYLESTMKMLIDYFNITSPIKNTPDTNTTDSQLQTKFNTLQSRYNTLEANYNSTVSELSDLRSRFNTIESLYNSTIDDNNEKQHTIDKLTQELNVATKRIEELESRDSQFQGSSSDESLNDDETNNDETNTQSDEPIEPVEIPTLSITLPDSMSLDNTDRTIDLYTYGTNNIRIDTYYPDTGTKYHINDKADITIYRDTEITNRQFIATNQDSYCYVGDLVVGQDPSIPISIQHTNSLQLQFRESDDLTRCDQAPNILFNDKLELNKEVYVRFVGTDGQIPFYYTNEIVEIPKCTTDNFDDNTDTLLNNTEICYGKSGSDIVIASKILAVFGITNQDIS